LPAEVGELVSLSELDCSYNRLTSLPASLGDLPNLYGLMYGKNRFSPEALKAIEENIIKKMEKRINPAKEE
jgi:Leucine-rich repeat (LRR) protein